MLSLFDDVVRGLTKSLILTVKLFCRVRQFLNSVINVSDSVNPPEQYITRVNQKVLRTAYIYNLFGSNLYFFLKSTKHTIFMPSFICFHRTVRKRENIFYKELSKSIKNGKKRVTCSDKISVPEKNVH